MKEIKRKKLYKYLIFFVVILFVIFLSLKSSVIREVLYLLFISFTIAYTLKPIQKRMEKSGLNKGTAALVLICIFNTNNFSSSYRFDTFYD